MTFAIACLASLVAGQSPVPTERPDIVVLLVDDLGFSDIGCYGGEIETPSLDRLADGGVRFTQFYNAGRCCPTRASLLTGLYSHQAGIGHMTGDYGTPSYQGYLNDRCATIAEALRGAGYATLMAGKWHVGSQPGRWPLDRGFERFYGIPTGGGVYFKDNFVTRPETFVVLGDRKVEIPDDWYVTDAITDHAVGFVREAAKKPSPFFLYLAHVAPHWPLQAKTEDIDKYRETYAVGWDAIRDRRWRRQVELGIIDGRCAVSPRDEKAKAWAEETAEARADLALRMAVFAAQIDRIDRNVGRLVEALKAAGRYENTLILFMSDNGASHEGGPHGFSRGIKGRSVDQPGAYMSGGLSWSNASNTPFRRHKTWVHEGGISTPLIAHWPRGIGRRGALERRPGHVIDVLPTCLDVTGAAHPEGKQAPEGRSLRPAFDGRPIERGALYWEHEGNRAVRDGRWKLVAVHAKPWELYDIEADRTELQDLAGDKPEIVRELTAKYDAWAERAGVKPWPVGKRK